MGKKRARCRSKSCVRARKRREKQHASESITAPPFASAKPSLFEEYQRAQNWLSEREQYSFFAALRRPLPICFRIRTEDGAKEFQRLLQQPQHCHVHAKPLPQNAWQMSADAALESHTMRQWLATHTRRGTISRQELVSTIPVLLLDVQSHHVVLDLCASPGSKTLQALDAMYASGAAVTGCIVANELNPKRAYVLAHRCQTTEKERMVHLAVVGHNATKFPNLLAPLKKKKQNKHKEGSSPKPFDRIICDVPCSGDGTLRKDVKVWKTWHPSYGIALHSLQLRIAKRGIALLKVGGLMTYSTCSFHPIENEAVVAALLATGCVEVVPCDAVKALRGIRRRSGLTHWKVLDDDCKQVKKEDAQDRNWPTTLWPPAQPQRSLQRCLRMVPSDNDSGGFFIALLRKVKEFPVGNHEESTAKKPAMVTPQQAHHQLYPAEDDTTSNRGTKRFTRGPGSSTCYELADPLAELLTQSDGSAKVNLVYAGHKEEPT